MVYFVNMGVSNLAVGVELGPIIRNQLVSGEAKSFCLKIIASSSTVSHFLFFGIRERPQFKPDFLLRVDI